MGESSENKYHFEKFTLRDDVNIEVYEEALDYVFESDDIRNVAISGAYGAGKSSVLASYKKKHPDKKFLHISLAHFNSEKKGGDEQKNVKIAKTTKDQDSTKDGRSISESVLEGKILNQLIHQIPSDDIPQTNFKVKQNINKGKIVLITLLCLTLIVCISYLCFFGVWRSFVGLFSGDFLGNILNLTLSKYTRLIAGIIILIITYKFIHDIIKLQKEKRIFKRINVQGNEIEILEHQDDSFFDKYLNEVLYLFENSHTDVIVFEDMDRFEMNYIFERLREINTLVNNQLANKDKSKESPKDTKFKPIKNTLRLFNWICKKIEKDKESKPDKNILRFFYLLRDDMFVSKDRTKFFDYIIPIVPVVDGTNSYDQFIEHLDKNDLTANFDQKFLQGISLYIDDMRLLKNVCNEFLIYYHRLNITKLNFNKMFAMITYKNLFPKDFSDLQNGQGYVRSLFDHKDEFVSSEREKLLALIAAKKKEIDDCRGEQLVDISELDIIKSSKYNVANSYPRSTNKQKDYQDWVDNVYPIRKAAIENKLNGRLLERELFDIELQLTKLKSRQLKDIINRENSQTIFHTTSVNEVGDENKYIEIKRSNYFALLKYLISEGYIDETYADYMTYFYPNSLSIVDKKFLRSIRDKQAEEYSYSLKNPALILTYLNVADFEEPETLNFDLFTYILNNNDEYSERFIIQLKTRRKFDFLSQYFTTIKIKNCIDKIIKYWPEYFFDVLADASMPYNQIREISLCILLYCDDKDIESANVDNCLTEFVSKTNDYLNLHEFNADRLIRSFELINVKFETINYDVSEKNIFRLVYEKNMYCFTYENIKNMMIHILNINDESTLMHRNYSILLSKADEPIYTYVKANILEYFRIIFDICDGMIFDDETTIINVLNDEAITEDIKNSYVTLSIFLVSDISQINNRDLWSILLKKKKLSFSENNLYHCFTEYKTLTPLLVDFINNYNGIIDISKISIEIDDQFENRLFNETIKCFALSDIKYEQILSSTNLCVPSFDIDNVPTSKMNILIDNEIIQMTRACLFSIRSKYQNVLFRFIKKNIDEYVNIMSSDIFVTSELIEILTWNIDEEYKIRLLDYTDEKISIIDKKYSDGVLSCILKNHFILSDLTYLLRTYNTYSESIKAIIFDISINNFARVVECATVLPKSFIKAILSYDNIDSNKKIELFIALLRTVSIEQAKIFATILGINELARVLMPNTRPKIPNNTQNRVILEQYKQRGWIYDYSVSEKTGYYSIRKHK